MWIKVEMQPSLSKPAMVNLCHQKKGREEKKEKKTELNLKQL